MQPSSILATLSLLLLLANCGSHAQQQSFPGPVESSGPRLPWNRYTEDRYEGRDQDQGIVDYGREHQIYREPARDSERDNLSGQPYTNYKRPSKIVDNIIIKEA